ncbi:MAG: hypothetical protein LBH76_09760 [Propionibacteriaceae bacterium]|jgi:hypothetical protein|nr:hypothetical protein [Propionibacteriaceae bacterium]
MGACSDQFKGAIEGWDASLRDEADLRERSLIHVAMTLARGELVVISPPAGQSASRRRA